MKNFVVVSKFYDNGNHEIRVFHKVFDKDQLDSFNVESRGYDLYVDEFATMDDAEEFAQQEV